MTDAALRRFGGSLLLVIAFGGCGEPLPEGKEFTSHATGRVLHITDEGTEEYLVGSDEACSYWHDVVWDESLGEIIVYESDTMSVSCLSPARGLIVWEDVDGHLADASSGEVRIIRAAGMCGEYLDATLTITEARGRELPLPETTTSDYLRRFTLTAECTCDSRCQGTWRIELEGEQTAEDVVILDELPKDH